MALTDYVIMPASDYQNACDAIREKDGSTEDIKSGELSSKILAISGGAEWKSWQLINGQCAVTAEDFRTYFVSETDAAVFSLFDASPLGIAQTIRGYRSLHHYDSSADGAIMSFPTISYDFSENGAVTDLETGDQVTIYILSDGNGNYTMQILYVCMNDTDVTAYINASAVPQTIYAMSSPFV